MAWSRLQNLSGIFSPKPQLVLKPLIETSITFHSNFPFSLPVDVQARVTPHQCRPFCPCFSHSVSRRHSSRETMRPVHVFGCPVTDRPCGKISALGLGSGLRAGGVATIATSATRGAMFGEMGGCDTCDSRDTGLAAGVFVAVVAEVAGGCPAISTSFARASNHIARRLHDAPHFLACSPAHHGSGFERHKPAVALKDAQRCLGLWAFAQRVRP